MQKEVDQAKRTIEKSLKTMKLCDNLTLAVLGAVILILIKGVML